MLCDHETPSEMIPIYTYPAALVPGRMNKLEHIDCNKDEYKATSGNCQKCPAGEIPDTVNKNKCLSCNRNEAESTPGTCTQCPIGKVQDLNNKTQCIALFRQISADQRALLKVRKSFCSRFL